MDHLVAGFGTALAFIGFGGAVCAGTQWHYRFDAPDFHILMKKSAGLVAGLSLVVIGVEVGYATMKTDLSPVSPARSHFAILDHLAK